MCRCLNCDGRFFKTLETRILRPSDSLSLSEEEQSSNTVVLMMKKRCKRCKHKYFYRKDWPENKTQPIAYELWREGVKIANNVLSSRGHVFASEYSKKISRHAEETIPYLKKLSILNRK